MGKCKVCGKPTFGSFQYCRECFEKIEKEKKETKEMVSGPVKAQEKPEAHGAQNHCAICGRPSGKYPLCFIHSKMMQTGEVVKCEKCGTWHLAKEACPKCNSVQAKPAIEVPEKKASENADEDDERKEFKTKAHAIGGEEDTDSVYCLICGKPTKFGHHFCIECYRKYAKKELFLHISGCKEAMVLAADYTSPKKCTDGHKVKSKTEREIDNYFFNHKIEHIYEATLWVDVNGEQKKFQPDFCLPNRFPDQLDEQKQNIYVEHLGLWGSDKTYDDNAKGKAKIYKENGLSVIFTYEEGMDDIDGTMRHDLNTIRCGDILDDPNNKK